MIDRNYSTLRLGLCANGGFKEAFQTLDDFIYQLTWLTCMNLVCFYSRWQEKFLQRRESLKKLNARYIMSGVVILNRTASYRHVRNMLTNCKQIIEVN